MWLIKRKRKKKKRNYANKSALYLFPLSLCFCTSRVFLLFNFFPLYSTRWTKINLKVNRKLLLMKKTRLGRNFQCLTWGTCWAEYRWYWWWGRQGSRFELRCVNSQFSTMTCTNVCGEVHYISKLIEKWNILLHSRYGHIFKV